MTERLLVMTTDRVSKEQMRELYRASLRQYDTERSARPLPMEEYHYPEGRTEEFLKLCEDEIVSFSEESENKNQILPKIIDEGYVTDLAKAFVLGGPIWLISFIARLAVNNVPVRITKDIERLVKIEAKWIIDSITMELQGS